MIKGTNLARDNSVLFDTTTIILRSATSLPSVEIMATPHTYTALGVYPEMGVFWKLQITSKPGDILYCSFSGTQTYTTKKSGKYSNTWTILKVFVSFRFYLTHSSEVTRAALSGNIFIKVFISSSRVGAMGPAELLIVLPFHKMEAGQTCAIHEFIPSSTR